MAPFFVSSGANFDLFALIVAETVREQDWDGIVTCHQGCTYARTWSYKNKVIVAAEKEKEKIPLTFSTDGYPSFLVCVCATLLPW